MSLGLVFPVQEGEGLVEDAREDVPVHVLLESLLLLPPWLVRAVFGFLLFLLPFQIFCPFSMTF